MKPAEYLSNDILEESHLRSFYPFRFVQMAFGSCRVHAKNRFVTAPTVLQKIYSIILLSLCLTSYICVIIYYTSRYFNYSNLYYLNITAVAFHYVIFACNVIHVRFMNNESNVKFYIKMQEIDRKMKIDKDEYINNLLFYSNCLTVASVLFSFFAILAVFSVAVWQNGIIFLSYSGLMYSQITCTLEWLFCANLLIYFYFRLRYINAIITNHLEGSVDLKVDRLKKFGVLSMKVTRCLTSEIHDFRFSDTDVFLKDIFEELSRFQNLYRFQIFLFCFKFVSNTLMSFEFGLLALQNNVLQWLECIVIPIITTGDLIIIIVICMRCEAFAREVKETKYLCITVLSLYYGGPLRNKAMKMLKMIKEKPPQISVYDMWHMDASTMLSMINLVTTLMMDTSTMLSMINLITTLMVTLLQFALF